ncbi:MAG: hypothetical protein AAB074_18325 [Planctomycetota bacterium]
MNERLRLLPLFAVSLAGALEILQRPGPIARLKSGDSAAITDSRRIRPLEAGVVRRDRTSMLAERLVAVADRPVILAALCLEVGEGAPVVPGFDPAARPGAQDCASRMVRLDRE